MEYITLAILTTLTSYATSLSQYGNGTRFIGLGYNILIGNPDGGDHSQSGIDPGIKTTRHILKLTPDTASQLIVLDGRSHCTPHGSSSVFYNAKSYQKYLLGDFVTFGPGDSSIMPYAFAASTFFKDIDHMTRDNQDVYRDDVTVCNEGRTRYVLPPTFQNLHQLTPEFSSAVCQLSAEYNQATYRQFLDKWGTHVIVGVETGTKEVKRYDQLLVELAKVALWEGAGTLSLENYRGYGTVVYIDPSKLIHIDLYKVTGGHTVSTLQLGLQSDPEPVSYKLATIAYFIDDTFMKSDPTREFCNRQALNLTRLQDNVVKALTEYPALYGINSSPHDSQLKVALMWPAGSYGLNEPRTGCPKSAFNWLTGWNRQDAEDYHNKNGWTSNIHLEAKLEHNKPAFAYCIKTVDDHNTGYFFKWPKGDYCILKKGGCPPGFNSGSLFWDDEDTANDNGHGGTLPDGSYGSNTRIDYCCRNDGNTAIFLPIDKPFYLLRHTGQCQKVYGMRVSEETFRIDTEDYNNGDSASGSHPYGNWNSHSDPTMHYCYYERTISSGGIFG